MTGKSKSLIIVFEHDIKDDDSEKIINAISMSKGVASVSSEDCVNYMDWKAVSEIADQIKQNLLKKICQIFNESQ